MITLYSNKMTKIGLSINIGSSLKNFYENGINQNIIFIYNLLEKQNYDVYFISQKKENTLFLLNKKYNNIFIHDIDKLLNLHIYTQIGTGCTIETLKELQNNNIKCIKWCLGNDYVYNSHTILHNKKNGLYISNFKFDNIWISPHFEYSIDYYKFIYKNKNVQVVPYIWEPTFLDNYTGTFDKNNIQIGIFESNFGIEKSCFIPMIICDKAKKYIKKSYVFCSSQLKNKELFVDFANTSTLVKQGKMTFEGRHKFTNMINKNCNVVVSFNENCGLNYLLLECLYLGIPLVHNSPFFKDYGYYYEGYDASSAAKHIENLYKHGFNREEYLEKNKSILYKYSTENLDNIFFFKNQMVKNINKKIAICVYIPYKHPYITIEYKRFYYCCKKYINGDLIVFGPKSIKSKLDSDVIFCELNDISNKTIYTYNNKKYNYPFINSLYIFTHPYMINILTNYTHILKTDTDTFITPSFKSYFLEEIVYIGKGKYVNDNFTKKQIKDYAIKNNYNHKNIHNIGATWFGKCSDIIKIGYLSYKINKQWIEDCQNNMDQFDWKGWPSFYDGVISMYSSEIAINHLEIPFKLEPNLLDFPSSSNNNINDYAHIHCYHNKDFFSKFESYTNNYLPIVENKIYSDISKINNFCLHISKITNTIKNNNIIKNLFNIPHILWINLDRSKIRYDNMKKIFNEYKLSNTRISGIDGKNEKYNNLVSKYGYPYFVTISHLKALHYFINNIDEDYCIICEDDLDINIVNYWDKTLNDYIKELPVTWEIFKLYTGNFINKKLINYSDEKSYGTVIYIIKKEGAKKIYNYYNNIILENLTYNNFHNNIIDLKIYNICETYVKPLFNFKLFNSLSNLTDSYSKEPCDIHNKINKLWGVK